MNTEMKQDGLSAERLDEVSGGLHRPIHVAMSAGLHHHLSMLFRFNGPSDIQPIHIKMMNK
jgi:hypothetical protein